MTVNLLDLAKPLEDVRFPNGSVHQPVPFGPAEYALWRELTKTTDPAVASKCGMQIIRACYPTVSDDDLMDCDGEMLLTLAAHPGRKIEQVKAALKNVAAVAAATQAQPPQSEPATTPSSPTTSGNTSSSKSRKRSGKTGGTSTSASPTDDPSSSGSATTTSKSLGGSTPYAVSWKTSTGQPSPASA